jgi:hypothetical protein
VCEPTKGLTSWGARGISNPMRFWHYLSTLANSTLIILISEMLKFSKIISSKYQNIVKDIILSIKEYSICWNENFKIN